MDEAFISPKQLAEKTGLPRSWIYSAAERGTIPHRKIGKYVLFVPSEIRLWLEERRRGPAVAGSVK